MAKESSENKKVIKWLKEHNIYYVRHHGGPFSKVAVADFLICLCGRFVSIEMKRKGEAPTKAQNINMTQVCSSGGVASWFDNGNVAVKWLDNLYAEYQAKDLSTESSNIRIR